MPDLKKVIKGLELLKYFLGNELPGKNVVFNSYINIVNDAITLLKEQENLAKCVDQEHRVNEYLNRQLAERPEIIRCKDCKRYYANGGACDQVLSEWFCADGKRKDGDGDD